MQTVRDIMRPSFLVLVQQTAIVSEAVHAMTEHNVGVVAMCDGTRWSACSPSGTWSSEGGSRPQIDAACATVP